MKTSESYDINSDELDLNVYADIAKIMLRESK